MHGMFERLRETRDNSIYRRWGVGVLALPALVAVALIGLAIIQPTASNWISEAVQAEFVGAGFSPDAAPTQLGKTHQGNARCQSQLTHAARRIARNRS